MPAARWQADRLELAVTFGRPLDADERLAELERDQQHAPRRLQDAVDAGDGVRLVGDRLELTQPDALQESPAAVRLRSCLDRLMPRVDITDVLAEVERWIGFTGQLTHAGGATPRLADLQQHLHAALLASGLKLGPTRMAECCPLSYRQLAWATEWYLGDEQLQAANDVLVDYLHQLQLAAHWGTGAFSSSDGQRSAARARAATADAMAREFGFRRGALNLVNWVSDQYSQYGTKVVSVAEREAIHTLEAILHTQLPITEHTTDTHGARHRARVRAVRPARAQLHSAPARRRRSTPPSPGRAHRAARRRCPQVPSAPGPDSRPVRRPPTDRGVAQARRTSRSAPLRRSIRGCSSWSCSGSVSLRVSNAGQQDYRRVDRRSTDDRPGPRLRVSGRALLEARGQARAVRERALETFEAANEDPRAFRAPRRYVVAAARPS